MAVVQLVIGGRLIVAMCAKELEQSATWLLGSFSRTHDQSPIVGVNEPVQYGGSPGADMGEVTLRLFPCALIFRSIC